MKVLIIIHKRKKKGGAVLQFLKLQKEMEKLGHNVMIYSIDRIKANSTFKKIYWNYKNLKNIIEKKEIDVLFTADPYFSALYALAARRKTIPIVMRIGSVFDKFYASRINEKLFKTGILTSFGTFVRYVLLKTAQVIFKKINMVIFNSYFLKRTYADIVPSSIVIHNGVKEFKIAKITKNKRLKLVYVGRIEPRKSIEIIIKSLILLKTRNIEFNFSLIGDITYFPQYWYKIEKLIEKGKLRKDIKLLGRVPNADLLKILNTHDILLFSTDERNFPITEGLPNVIIEGMASGLAIIATSVAGVPELISKQNGYCVEPSEYMFAEKIEYLEKNREMLFKMKSRNIQKAKDHFSIEEKAKKYVSIFQNIMNK